MDVYPDPPVGRPSPYGTPVGSESPTGVPYGKVAGRPEPDAIDDPYAQWRSQPVTGPVTAAVSLLVPGLEREPGWEPEWEPAPEAAPRGRRRAKIVCGLVAVAAGFGIVGALLPDLGTGDTTLSDRAASITSPGPGTSSSLAPGSSSGHLAVTAAAAAAPAKIGARVRDGDLEFTVTGTRTTKTVGNEYVSAKAHGQFLLVSLTARNVGGEDELFTAAAQMLYDSKGHPYAVDCVSAAYLGDDGANYIAQLDPGTSVTVSLVFDVPPGTVPDRVELQDSIPTGGVTVRLTR